MGHFSMEIYAPTGSNLSGNQHSSPTKRTTGTKRSRFTEVQIIGILKEGNPPLD